MARFYDPEGDGPRGYSEQYASADWGYHTFPDGTIVIFDKNGRGGGSSYMVLAAGATTFTTIPIRDNSGGQFVWARGGYVWYSNPTVTGGGSWVMKPTPGIPIRSNKR